MSALVEKLLSIWLATTRGISRNMWMHLSLLLLPAAFEAHAVGWTSRPYVI